MLPQQPRLVPAHIPLGKFLVTEQKQEEKKKKKGGGWEGGVGGGGGHPPHGLCLTFVMTGIQ